MCSIICPFKIHCLILVTEIPRLVTETWERAVFWNILSKSYNVHFLVCGVDITGVDITVVASGSVTSL